MQIFFPNALLILVLNRPLTLTKCKEWLMEMCLNRNYFSPLCKLERVLLSAICKKHFLSAECIHSVTCEAFLLYERHTEHTCGSF